MASLARSSIHIARLSSTPRRARSSLCGICILQFRSSLDRSFHASAQSCAAKDKPPPPPPEFNNKNKPSNKSTPPPGSKKDQGKPTAGFEGLYNGKSPLSKSDAAAEDEGGEPQLPPGRVWMNKDEEERLVKLLDRMKRDLPGIDADQVDRLLKAFRRVGMPQEMREILDSVKSGKRLTLSQMAKVFKYSNNMFWETMDQDNKDAKAEAGKRDKSDTKDSMKNEESSGQKGKDKKSSSTSTTVINFDLLTFTIFATFGYIAYRRLGSAQLQRDITFQEFRTAYLEKGLVEKVTTIGSSKVRVDLNREAVARMYPDNPGRNANFSYYFSIGSVDAFERKLDAAQEELGIPSNERIPVVYSSDSTPLSSILLNFGPTLMVLGVVLYFMRRAGSGGSGSGIFSMGRSRAKKFSQDTDVKIRFKDVAGMDEAKREVMEFVSFLKEPGQYQRLGAKIPRGALLSGPPGTGKTMLAKATAGESGVPFFSISGSEFVEIFVGVGPSRVRDLFSTARKSAPCIIFIDEIDAIGKSRSKNMGFGGNDEREGTLNQILTEMDGFNTSEQVVVLAGTNRPDVLDKALLRPGRFDRHISIDPPTLEGRKQIFVVHLEKITTNENIDKLTGRLAALTPGFSGADIANCVNEAALNAARESAPFVILKHFEAAIERVVGGLEKKSLVLNPVEKRTVAYHEAGHAICGWFFKYADPLLKVSIIPRGSGALGYAQYLPPPESYLMTVRQMTDRMAMALGGRVSEELHFDTVTSGASDDFDKVTRMATAMVCRFGMSEKLGYIYWGDDKTGAGAGSRGETQFQKPFSERTAQTIDEEVRRLVDEAYAQCRALLTEKKEQVGIVAEELLAKEVLGRDDLIRLLGKRPFEEDQAFTKYFGGGGGGNDDGGFKKGGKDADPPTPLGKGKPDAPAPPASPPGGAVDGPAVACSGEQQQHQQQSLS